MILEANPSIFIAGTGGDCGKTLVSLSLTAYYKSTGLVVAAYKKGPDYIDAAWLKWILQAPARNLDTYMVQEDIVREQFFYNSRKADISIIEGNRGLYDGLDPDGTHSSAELAKLLGTPIILVINAAKVTRTVAAIIYGLTHFDPDVPVAGVIFNRVAGSRHESILQKSLEAIDGPPVVGFIPKLPQGDFLPGRHLGLVTPEEHSRKEELLKFLQQIVEKYCDTDALTTIAQTASGKVHYENHTLSIVKRQVKICYFSDSAFTFYYPENLEALARAGAELIPLSSMSALELPDCHGLYIGGGFPETHVTRLSANSGLMKSVKDAAEQGMPVYAECGGLIYLCRSLKWGDDEHPFAGVFPLILSMEKKPQGHGYCEVIADFRNPFFKLGSRVRGHEFHYTRIIKGMESTKTSFSVQRGAGCFNQRDGLVYKNVLAAYLHIHALGNSDWALNFVNACRDYSMS